MSYIALRVRGKKGAFPEEMAVMVPTMLHEEMEAWIDERLFNFISGDFEQEAIGWVRCEVLNEVEKGFLIQWPGEIIRTFRSVWISINDCIKYEDIT